MQFIPVHSFILPKQEKIEKQINWEQSSPEAALTSLVDFALGDGQNEPESQYALQILHGDQRPEDGSGSQGVAAPSLQRLGVRSAAAHQVDEGGVEGEDGAAHVDVILVILGRQAREVELAAKAHHPLLSLSDGHNTTKFENTHLTEMKWLICGRERKRDCHKAPFF